MPSPGRSGVLKTHKYDTGEGQGAYSDALVQYGFVNRDGAPLARSIRSNLDEMLRSEAQVRKWWNIVPEDRRYGWVSPWGIHTQWKKGTNSAQAQQGEG